MITNLSPTGPLQALYFMRCTGARVGLDGALSLIFGPWSLTTEDGAWRVLKGAEIIAGRGGPEPMSQRLDQMLTGCALQAIQPFSALDLRLVLSEPFLVESFGVKPEARSVFAIRRDGQLLFDWTIAPTWSIAPIHGHAAGHA